MRFGIRGLLLVVAVVLFVLAVVLDENASDLLAIGLALMAGAMLVCELVMDRPLDGRGDGSNR